MGRSHLVFALRQWLHDGPRGDATPSEGGWSDIVDVSVRIDCPVSIDESTWGQIKANYR